MAYKPSDKRKAPDSQINPDVTPIMNLMVVLIPLLLSVAEFIKIGLLEYSPPPIEEAGGGDNEGEGEENDADAPKPMNLLLNISEENFEISMFGATQEGENFKILPKVDGEYDYDALHKELVRIRQDIIGEPVSTETTQDPETGQDVVSFTWQYSDAEMLKITAKGDIPWQVLVSVLDESREFEDKDGATKPLFATPVMGQVQ